MQLTSMHELLCNAFVILQTVDKQTDKQSYLNMNRAISLTVGALIPLKELAYLVHIVNSKWCNITTSDSLS